VGLTVVAFGTSSPELAVSTVAAWDGRAGVAVGNVVGSNLCNMLLILGLTALVRPLVVDRWLVVRDGPLMLGLAGLMTLFMLDGAVGRVEGAVLFAVLTVYLVLAVAQARSSEPGPPGEPRPGRFGGAADLAADVGRVVVGLALLTVGSDWLVEAASVGARALGISELVVGLTIVSIGTSLPEIATSLLAAARGQRDLAAGNVVGSNIFNVGCVLGLAGMVSPEPIVVEAAALGFDLPWMMGTGVVVLAFLAFRREVSRLEGGTLAALYAAYLLALVLDAQGRVDLPAQALPWFVVGGLIASPALAIGLRRLARS
jgi:cation:H+ antiporter